jgi:hypothetical protein
MNEREACGQLIDDLFSELDDLRQKLKTIEAICRLCSNPGSNEGAHSLANEILTVIAAERMEVPCSSS